MNELLLLILPVFCAGLTFIVYLKLFHFPLLNIPLDNYKKFRNKRIFGTNKTIKGPLIMALFTSIFGIIVYSFLKNTLSFFYSHQMIIGIFALAGFAYSLGELPTSFIKRQLDISPGESTGVFFSILDIFDSLIAIAIVYLLFLPVSFTSVITALLIGGLIHVLTDILMRYLKLKE